MLIRINSLVLRGVSTSVQGLNQSDQLLLYFLIQLHELNAHAWKQKVSLRFIADPGNLRLRFQFIPRPIRKSEFNCQLGARTERSTTLNKEPTAADSSRETVELLSFRR